jgi:hypothetical protein
MMYKVWSLLTALIQSEMLFALIKKQMRCGAEKDARLPRGRVVEI